MIDSNDITDRLKNFRAKKGIKICKYVTKLKSLAAPNKELFRSFAFVCVSKQAFEILVM